MRFANLCNVKVYTEYFIFRTLNFKNIQNTAIVITHDVVHRRRRARDYYNNIGTFAESLGRFRVARARFTKKFRRNFSLFFSVLHIKTASSKN